MEHVLKESYENKNIDKDDVKKLIDDIRVERRLAYIRKKEDNTCELIEELVSNNRFKELVVDNRIELIW